MTLEAYGEIEVIVGSVGIGRQMGEMAFLGTPGLRTATVHAVVPSRLLVLRRRFLRLSPFSFFT